METLEEKHKRVTGMLEALAEDEQGGVDLEDGGLLLLNVDGSVNSQGVKRLFDRIDEGGNGYIDMAEVDTSARASALPGRMKIQTISCKHCRVPIKFARLCIEGDEESRFNEKT